jgi:hypothetical protein
VVAGGTTLGFEFTLCCELFNAEITAYTVAASATTTENE